MPSKDMTLREHLEEVRRRLAYVTGAVVLGAISAFIFRDRIFKFLLDPGFGRLPETKPVFTEVTEMIGVTMKVSLMMGVILAIPVVVYHLVMFIAPGLTKREKVYLFILLPGTLLVFALGAAFGYYVLFPQAFKFLFTFGTGNADAFIRIGSYMNVITMLLFWMGLIFEIPIVMFILARLGVTSPKFLSRFRRYALIMAFVLGALITPTMDPINQTLVALPVVILYEIGIVLARIGFRLRGQRPSESK